MSRGRRRHRMRVSHERWLVSYADFITLLFAFFVVLYATALLDKKKVSELSAAIQVAFQQMGALPATVNPTLLKERSGAEKTAAPNQSPTPSLKPNPDLAALQRELEQTLALEIARNQVALRNSPDGLVVSLREGGFFESGSAGVKVDSQPAFGRIAGLLAQQPYRIRIEGHTDNVPIHNAQFPSNWELSTGRATELVRLLIVKYGFDPERLSAAGYAQYHPIASNDTPQGQAQNRRVDLVVVGKQPAENNEPTPEVPQKPSPGTPKTGGPP